MAALNIPESLETLKKVQEIDREIYTARQELASFPEKIHQLTLDLEAEKSRMLDLEKQLKDIQVRQRAKEGELAEKEGLIRKYDAQLAQVKTNKEYASLQKEIDSLKADCSMVEDSILAILDEIDQVQRAVREERGRLAEVEKESVARKTEFDARGEVLKAHLDELTGKRSSVISQVPEEARRLYEKILDKKEGLALVPLVGEACGACRIDIRPQLLNELKMKEALVVCEHCSRILYTD